jgi:mRNA interferase MazF
LTINRGQIYLVNLDPVQGREQRGRRPVLVVSSNAINRQPLVITVVVGTSAANVSKDYPTNVRIPAAESGLPKESVFLCFQLRSLDPARFAHAKPVGTLPAKRMEEIATALRLTLELGS